ncbi:histidinol-phosphate/aromatic aminotransferase/cobyric acid decarboxylase-like protein [Pseudomonas sp. TE3786]
MPRRILHDGPADFILCFAQGSIELSQPTVIREERLGLYSVASANPVFPSGANYVIVRFAGEQLSGNVTQQAKTTLFFS